MFGISKNTLQSWKYLSKGIFFNKIMIGSETYEKIEKLELKKPLILQSFRRTQNH